MRARLALMASGQQCELREVLLRDKPAALLAASPKATVPVLVTPDGTVIDQSLDIMLWALRRHDPLAWLAPDGGSLDDMLALIATCDGEFKTQLDRYKYPGRFTLVEGQPAPRDRGAAFLSTVDARLAPAGHLFGHRPSLADAALLPFVRQFAMVDPHWFAEQPWAHLGSWLQAWLGSASFSAVMARHNPWAPGMPGVAFPAD